ncbi:hypothetical protein L4C37_10600 [Vibrio kagoshimensis]|uniref:hypothetical protein n=1 Tax=Vibrio kagoshimensis TaxID=2910244 RepID=UPI003D19C69B
MKDVRNQREKNMNHQEQLAQIKAERKITNQEEKAERELLYIQSSWYQKTAYTVIGSILILGASDLIFNALYSSGYSFRLNAFSFSFSSSLITFSLLWWFAYSRCKTKIGRNIKLVTIGLWAALAAFSYFMIYGAVRKADILYGHLETIPTPDGLSLSMTTGIVVGLICSVLVGNSMREYIYKAT